MLQDNRKETSPLVKDSPNTLFNRKITHPHLIWSVVAAMGFLAKPPMRKSDTEIMQPRVLFQDKKQEYLRKRSPIKIKTKKKKKQLPFRSHGHQTGQRPRTVHSFSFQMSRNRP